MTKLNNLIKDTHFENMDLQDIIQVTALSKENHEIFYHAGEHFNHSFFWNCIAEPEIELGKTIMEKIEDRFDNIQKFKDEVS